MLRDNPRVKVALRGCEFAPASLVLDDATSQLDLYNCKGALKASMFTQHFKDSKPGKALERVWSEEADFERGLLGDVGSYLSGGPLPEENRGRNSGRTMHIDRCPIAPLVPSDEGNLFRVLWDSLAERPGPTSFRIVNLPTSSLALSNVELSVEQLQALLEPMRPGHVLTLTRVTITGDGASPPEYFKGKWIKPFMVEFEENPRVAGSFRILSTSRAGSLHTGAAGSLELVKRYAGRPARPTWRRTADALEAAGTKYDFGVTIEMDANPADANKFLGLGLHEQRWRGALEQRRS